MLTDSWVEARLIALGFQEVEVRRHLKTCVLWLRDNALFDEQAADRFFRDQKTRVTLEDIYRRDLRRTGRPLDPVGFCLWGPRLHRCWRWERDAMEAYLRTRIRDLGDRGAR